MSAMPARPEAKETASIRVSAETRRRLLTIQYARKMAGRAVSIGQIVDEGLDALERAS